MIEAVGDTLLRSLERVDLNFRRNRCGSRDGIEGQAIGYSEGVRSRAASSRRVFMPEECGGGSGIFERRKRCRLREPWGRVRRSGGCWLRVCSITCRIGWWRIGDAVVKMGVGMASKMRGHEEELVCVDKARMARNDDGDGLKK